MGHPDGREAPEDLLLCHGSITDQRRNGSSLAEPALRSASDVGLFGKTPALLRMRVSATPFNPRGGTGARGIEYVRPSKEEREEINRIIFDELVYGVFNPEGISYFQKVIVRLKDEGCDAVVLGCTEIPLIMSDENSPLPTLDSTRLLARAALKEAVSAKAAG